MEGYTNGLDKVAQRRYAEKTALLDGEDPYKKPKSGWLTEYKHLPPITYVDIVNYLVFAPSPFCSLSEIKNYKSLESYDRFLCGWVRDIATFPHISTADGKVYHVVSSKVLHSQRLNEAPLHPWLISDPSGQVLSAHCNCMAGLGESCTHVASLMFAVEAIVRLRESATVTQEPAYWKLPASLKKVEYACIRDIDFTSSKSLKKKLNLKIQDPTATTSSDNNSNTLPQPAVIPPASATEFNNFLFTINSDQPACLAVHPDFSDQYVPLPLKPRFPQVLPELYDENLNGRPYEEVVEHCSNVFSKLSLNKEEVAAVELETRSQSRSRTWFQFRAGRITASVMKSAVKTSLTEPSKSLLRQICYPSEVKFHSNATEWGCKHESIARDTYARSTVHHHQNFVVTECGLFLNCDHPHIGATPDGIVDCDCCGKGCLEIKCPYCVKDDFIDSRIVYLENLDGELRLKRNSAYYYQVQTQLFMTNLDYCDFVVWSNNDIFVERITPCLAFWKPVAEKAKQFFISVVLPEICAGHFLKTVSISPCDTAEDEELFCTCRSPEDGSKYIGCDGVDCRFKWFHFKCVGLVRKPKGNWYCSDCSDRRKGKKRKHINED